MFNIKGIIQNNELSINVQNVKHLQMNVILVLCVCMRRTALSIEYNQFQYIAYTNAIVASKKIIKLK